MIRPLARRARDFIRPARGEGHRFVGCNCCGFNAFFVRNDLAPDLLPEADATWWFRHPKVLREAEAIGPEIAGLPWLDV